MSKFNLITPCSRPQNLIHVYNSILKQDIPLVDITWWIVYDMITVPELSFTFDGLIVNQISHKDSNSISGNGQRNLAINNITDGWVYFLDDDNIIFDGYLKTIKDIEYISNTVGNNIQLIIGDQILKNGTKRCTAAPQNTKVCGIDTAQYIMTRELIGGNRWILNDYNADGHFIEHIYNTTNKDFVLFINKNVCYYNYITT